MSSAPLDSHAPLSYLPPGQLDGSETPPSASLTSRIDSPGDEAADVEGLDIEKRRAEGVHPQGRVAFYDTPDQARKAVKLLVNSGFDSQHVIVLYYDNSETFDTLGTWVPVEPPSQDSGRVFMATNGAGAGIAGGVLLASIVAWPIAIVAAGVGGLAGGAIGAMLGTGTFGNEETRQLAVQYHDRIAEGAVVVVVKPMEGDDAAKMERATELLTAAAEEE